MVYSSGAPARRPLLPGINTPMQQNQPNSLQELLAAITQNQSNMNTQSSGLGEISGLMQGGGLMGPTSNFIIPNKQEQASRIAQVFERNGVTPPQASEPQTIMEPKESEELDPIAMLYDLMTSGGGSLDADAMIQQATGGINQAYGAQIGTIRHQNQGARADTKEGTKEIQAMYRALSKDMRKSGRKEARQGKALSEQLQGLGSAGAANVNASADQLLTQNAAAADALDAPGIAQQLNSEVNTQSMQQAGNAVNSATRQATNQLGMSGVNRRYFNEAAGSSNLEGTNRSADLIANLQDYLQGNRDKIAEVAGQRAQAVASARNSILAQVSEDQGEEKQQMIDNIFNLTKFRVGNEQWEAERQDKLNENNTSPSPNDFLSKGMGNVMGLLQTNPALAPFMKEAMGSPEFRQGYFEDGKANVDLQGNYAAMEEYLEQAGILDQVAPEMIPYLIDALTQMAPNSQRPSF